MKKNIFMRLACVVLVLTLLSTCVISGTFAKYVTSDTASDAAHVAKFGVKVEIEGDDMFETQYTTDDTKVASTIEYSVKSSGTDKVVAPGTNSAEDGDAVKFSISGTPEVAINVDIEMKNLKDVYLGDGTYTDWTKADVDNDDVNYDDDDNETYTLTEDYYPIVWTLKVDDAGNPSVVANGTLAEIEQAVEAYVTSKPNYEANTFLDETYTLEWNWAFEQDMDKADTTLGNINAGIEKDAKDYCTDVSFDLAITVTQID